MTMRLLSLILVAISATVLIVALLWATATIDPVSVHLRQNVVDHDD